MRRKLFWLDDHQWQGIAPLLQTDVRGMARVDDRRVISGILHVLKSGCRWCDCPPAPRLIRRTKAARKLLGDKAYDNADLRHWLKRRGTSAVIPNRSNRKQPFSFDRKSYKQRHRIENAFCRLKDFRRIATRYDRLARNFLASICLVAAVVWWIL